MIPVYDLRLFVNCNYCVSTKCDFIQWNLSLQLYMRQSLPPAILWNDPTLTCKACNKTPLHMCTYIQQTAVSVIRRRPWISYLLESPIHARQTVAMDFMLTQTTVLDRIYVYLVIQNALLVSLTQLFASCPQIHI